MVRKSKKNNLVVQEPQEELLCKVWNKDKILTSKNEIDYYKIQINQVLIKNKLVGFVTDEGNYTFEDEIRRDLVRMKKEVVDSTYDIYTALSVYMGKAFNFSVVVDYKNNDLVEATLYLNETVEGYEPVKSLHTFVAKILLPYDDKLKENIYINFNLVDSIQKIDDLLVPNLAVKMQTMIDEQLIFDQVTDLGAQIYVMRTLKMLSKAGKQGQEIANEFKKQAEKIKTETSTEKQTHINVLLQKALDKVIDEKGGFEALPIESEEKYRPMKEYVESMQKAEMLKSGVEVKGKKTEAKTEKSASSTSKPVAKKAAPTKKAATKKSGGGKDKGSKKGKGTKKDKGDTKKPTTGQYGASVVTTVKHEDKPKEEKPAKVKQTPPKEITDKSNNSNQQGEDEADDEEITSYIAEKNEEKRAVIVGERQPLEAETLDDAEAEKIVDIQELESE